MKIFEVLWEFSHTFFWNFGGLGPFLGLSVILGKFMEFSLECPGGFLQFLDFHTGFYKIFMDFFSREFGKNCGRFHRLLPGIVGVFK